MPISSISISSSFSLLVFSICKSCKQSISDDSPFLLDFFPAKLLAEITSSSLNYKMKLIRNFWKYIKQKISCISSFLCLQSFSIKPGLFSELTKKILMLEWYPLLLHKDTYRNWHVQYKRENGIVQHTYLTLAGKIKFLTS